MICYDLWLNRNKNIKTIKPSDPQPQLALNTSNKKGAHQTKTIKLRE